MADFQETEQRLQASPHYQNLTTEVRTDTHRFIETR
jgi:hypothetical protein